MIAFLFAIMGLLGALLQIDQPLGNALRYFYNNDWPNTVFDPNVLAALYVRGKISESIYLTCMKYLGHGNGWALDYANVNRTRLAAGDFISLWRRQEIEESQLEKHLTDLGYDKEQQRLGELASRYFPGPLDLVRFAVREVYTPAVVARFQTDEDLPLKYLGEAEKAGVPKEQAINFWRAHWELPSAEMGFSMFQRDIINYETLVLLLKTLDVMPFWRDKLIELAYDPLTRVDVRRMYGEGVLPKELLPAKYRAQGYSPENAQLLTDFTVKYENRDTKGITRAQAMKAYVDELLTREELTLWLSRFGYSDEVVTFWLDQADYQKTESELSMITDDLTQQYLVGGRDLASVKVELDSIDLPATYVNTILRRIVAKKGQKLKVPAPTDLDRWLDRGWIEEGQYTAQMRLLGFEEWSIELFLTEHAEGIDTSTRKYLPITTYSRWVKGRIISPERFRAVLRVQLFSESDIAALCAENGVDYGNP